jgi:rubrerythrin
MEQSQEAEMDVFDVGEVMQFAIRIEENGEEFYRHVAKRAAEQNVRSVFTYLADAEVVHKRTFSHMVSQVRTYEPVESYPGEYFAYLRAFVDGVLFNEDEMNAQMGEVVDAVSAVDFGIRKELQSIQYYEEMKKFVPKPQHDVLERVINEERKHFVELSELREELTQ